MSDSPSMQRGRALYPALLVVLAACTTALLGGWFADMSVVRQAREGDLARLAAMRDLQSIRLLDRLAAQRHAIDLLASDADVVTSSPGQSVPGRRNIADAVSDDSLPVAANQATASSNEVGAVRQESIARIAAPAGLSVVLLADRATGAVQWVQAADPAVAASLPLAGLTSMVDPVLRDTPLGRAFNATPAAGEAQRVSPGAAQGEAREKAAAARMETFGSDIAGEVATWWSLPVRHQERDAVLLARASLAQLQSWLDDTPRTAESVTESAGDAPVLRLITANASDAQADLVDGATRERVFARDAAQGTAGGDASGARELVAVRRLPESAGGLTLALEQKIATVHPSAQDLILPLAGGSALIALVLGAVALRRGGAIEAGAPTELALLRAEHDAVIEKAGRENDSLNDSVVRIMESVGAIATARDFTQRVPVTEDVTGAIADALNVLTEETGRSIAQIKRVSADVETCAAGLVERAAGAERHAAAERDELQQAVQELTAAVAAIGEANRQADVANEAARRADAAGENASQAVRATADTVRRARELIRQTEKRVKRLGEHSQEIGQVVGIIDSIAERTGILALNTSLQAAAAGDAGRQFAGLADEVKRLSKAAGQATAQIGRMVGAIQTETADSVATVSGAIMQIVEISDLIGEADLAMNAARTETRAVVERIAMLAESVADQALVSTRLQERARRIGHESDESLRELQTQSAESVRLVDMAQLLTREVAQFRTGADQ